MKSLTLARLRRFLITGLIVIAPIMLTAWVLVWLFDTLDAILGRYLVPVVGLHIPGLGLIALVLVLLLVGWVSQRAAGRRALNAWNALLGRVPLARRIYGGSSQIVRAVLDREERLFEGVGLIEYPMSGSYALVFITARAPDEVEAHIGRRALSVFLPTVPNPTTGYLLLLPADQVRVLDMTVEEGVRMVLSAGMAAPHAEHAAGPAGGDVAGAGAKPATRSEQQRRGDR